MISRGVSVDEVVNSYWIFLARNHYDAHLQKFKQRLNSDLKAAEAEAIVFPFLWSSKANPDVYEKPGAGGPDFCCKTKLNAQFLIEVTSLESAAVARRSNLPDRIDGSGGSAFGMITTALCKAAAAKAVQLANYPFPRVLAITSSHAFASILMDRHAAQNLLISDPMISYRLGDVFDNGIMTTDLRKAVFFRPDKITGQIVPCRRSISAILLVAISGGQSDVVGIIHPQPSMVFDPDLFPKVPYVRMKEWPIINGKVLPEWLSNNGECGTFYHTRIR